MTGNSMDAADAVLADFSEGCAVLATARAEISSDLAARLRRLAESSAVSVDELLRTEVDFTEVCADAVRRLEVDPRTVGAVGCHGQTLAHRPKEGVTWQLLNGALLAERVGMPVVCDFRRRDVASGGEGAPFAPLFHRFFFSRYAPCQVVNVGGIANVTYLTGDGGVRGWDLGPGMMLMDAWRQRHDGERFDRDGRLAREGAVVPSLLEKLSAHPFLLRRPPKSCGREEFALGGFLEATAGLAAADVQATFLALTVEVIAAAVTERTVFLCGGGANNAALVEGLAGRLPSPPRLSDDLGLPKECVEAAAFAWLARCHLRGEPLETASVTGGQPRLAGALYPN